MTTQQIENSIALCKGNSLSTIKMALTMRGGWNRQCLEDMAKYFNCDADIDTVALHLQMGF